MAEQILDNNKTLEKKIMTVLTERDQLKIKLQEGMKSLQMKQSDRTGGANEMEYLQLKVDSLEKKLKCPICNYSNKEVILPCLHMFCEGCMKKNISSRQRQCPLDRSKIGNNDIKKILWGDEQ